MSIKDEIIKKVTDGVLLFDGGMGTELYNHGLFINHCFEAVNIQNPGLVLQIHNDYVKAGVDVLQTNTFGANRFKLSKHHLEEDLFKINVEGVRLARQAADGQCYVAASVGPLGVQIEPLGPLSYDEARDAFKEQISALLAGEPDIIVIETFMYPDELYQAVSAARELCDLPIVALMTIDEDLTSLTGASPDIMIAELEESGADIIGINGTCGPQPMLRWIEQVRKLTTLPIAIMPFAGKPKNVDGRNIYLASPEYLGEYAKHFVQAGSTVIGGSSGIGPAHIKKMRNSINAIKPTIKKQTFTVKEKPVAHKDIEITPTHQKSRLARRIHDGHFVTFVELLSPKGVDCNKELTAAREMSYFGADVINIPDGPRASARMSALALALQIQNQIGIETVLHYVCRDRNVIGIQSDLLGAYALGLKNILAITGDPPKLGNYPDATAVFDVDAIGLVNILNRLNHGLDIAGNPIGKPASFFIGVGANPGAVNMDEELRRLDWKVDAGAEFIVTQPVFDVKLFEDFLKRTEHLKIPVIAGIWPLTSIRNAEFMNNEIPGCYVPDNLLSRLRKYEGQKEESRNEGINISREILIEIKDMVSGVQISAPFGRVQSVVEMLEGVSLK